MLTRLRPRLVIDLARRDLPAPVDVVNLITTGRFRWYRWYGLLVFPALQAVGGRVLWMGRHERTVRGAQQADKLLLVRYPSHRRFLAMTLNPYYLAINRLREAGVRRFEASFTHATRTAPDLHRASLLVGAHFNSPPGEDVLGRLSEVLAPVCGEPVYATRAVASVTLAEPPAATDPNPLSLGQLVLFAPPGGAPPNGDLAGLAARAAGVVDDLTLHVYRREPRSVYRPSLGWSR